MIESAGFYIESAGRMVLGKHFLFSSIDTGHAVELIGSIIKDPSKLEVKRRLGYEIVKKFEEKRIIEDWLE